MSGFDLCTPKNETLRPRYFQNRIIIFCLPVSTFMYVLVSDLNSHNRSAKDRSWEYLKSLKDTVHEYRNWEQGRAVLFLGIYVSNFRYSVFHGRHPERRIRRLNCTQVDTKQKCTPHLSQTVSVLILFNLIIGLHHQRSNIYMIKSIRVKKLNKIISKHVFSYSFHS
jgi:hypothetical protein